MRIDILSAVPRLLDSWFGESILQRAQSKGLVEVRVHDLRDWSTDKHRRLDDYPFGGGAGMVMQVEPIHRAIEQLKAEREYDEVIYLSPDGELLQQRMVNQLSIMKNMILLCGHYKGVDERVREHLITREISIGDYVLSGGELAAAVLSDAATASRTAWWPPRSIPVRPSTMAGRCPRCCSAAIRPASMPGGTSRRCSAPGNAVLDCWVMTPLWSRESCLILRPQIRSAVSLEPARALGQLPNTQQDGQDQAVGEGTRPGEGTSRLQGR
jgi:hypothetical protein